MKNKPLDPQELELLYARHAEPVKTDGLTRRDFIIFQEALKNDLKKISKLADKERQHFGSGNFSELEDYIEHLQRKVGAILDPMVLTV
jgi:hypothetical protein